MSGGGEPTDPGGTGDPWIHTLGGNNVQFQGVPGGVYKLLSHGRLLVLPRIEAVPDDPEGRTFFCGVDILIDDVRVVVLEGRTHVLVDGHHVEVESKHCTLDSPGHFGNTQDEPHPLQGVPHINVMLRRLPPSLEGAHGLVVDGDQPEIDPESYRVPEPF